MSSAFFTSFFRQIAPGLIIILLCVSFNNNLLGQCTISGVTNVNLGESPSGLWPYTVTFTSGLNCGNLDASWSGPSLGTILFVNCNSNNGTVLYNIEFTRADASSVLKITSTSTSGTTECTLPITVSCTPVTPAISSISNFPCGSTTPIPFTVTTFDDPISTFNFTGTTGGSATGTQSGSSTVNGIATPATCSPGIGLVFNYTNACGTSTRTKTISPALTVGSIDGDRAVCTVGTGVEVYSATITGAPNDCIDVNWEITPATGLDMTSRPQTTDGVAYLSVLPQQVGNYVIKLTVTGCSLQPEIRTINVKVSSAVPSIPAVPPVQLQYVCTEEGQVCYNFSGYDVFEFFVDNPDNKLIVYKTGSTLCLSSIWPHPRTTTISVTPSNGCGVGTTRNWNIYIDHPYQCEGEGSWSLINPPNDETGLEEKSYNLKIVDSRLTIEDLNVLNEQETKHVTIYSINGQLLHSFIFHEKVYDFDFLGKIPPGVLVVRIANGENIHTEKIYYGG